MVRAQKRRLHGPTAIEEPVRNWGGKIAAARCDGEGTRQYWEGTRQYWTVAAHLARDVESRPLGFAMATVRSDDD